MFQPGCVNTTELDIKKACRMNKSAPTRSCGVDGQSHKDQSNSNATVDALNKEIAFLKQRLDRRNFKISKVAEA